MDGLKTITKIQATGLNIRFLIISAYANFSYAREAMRLGVKDFLEKPIDEDELNKALYRIAYEEEKIENKEIEKINDNKKNEEKEVSGIIQSAKKYIDEHFSEKLTLEEVAEYVYLSPNYLSSLFRREMNMNFVEYITDVRMRQAEKFLADARLSISDIARMTGYRDAGYFCNVFIRKYGMSPSLWRKRNKGI